MRRPQRDKIFSNPKVTGSITGREMRQPSSTLAVYDQEGLSDSSQPVEARQASSLTIPLLLLSQKKTNLAGKKGADLGD